jgi:hypothetical protein
MVTRDVLEGWVVEALRASHGVGSPASVAKYIWQHYRTDLEASGDLYYTWQYDIRWAAQRLRDTGKLIKANNRNVPWQIAASTDITTT